MPDVGDRVYATFQNYIQEDLSKLNVKVVVGNADEVLSIIK